MAVAHQSTTSSEIEDKAIDIVKLLMKRPITEEIAMAVDTYDRFKLLEISDGNWVGFDEDEYMTGEEHGRIEFLLLLLLGNYIVEHKLGMLYPGDTDFVLDGEPGNIRIRKKPDIGFVRQDRLKKSKEFVYGAPDLAVEITSPSDTASDIQSKIDEYFQYGTQQVWQVYPATKQIVVHLSDGTSQKYGVDDVIHGGQLLTGFQLDVSKVFES